jgi:hypothetical protein
MLRLLRLLVPLVALALASCRSPGSGAHDRDADVGAPDTDAAVADPPGGRGTAPASGRLTQLWSGAAHFIPDQHPAPVPGALGHREAFAVDRPDLGPGYIYLYHRCYSSPPSMDICLDVSHDGGTTFVEPHGIVIHRSHAFAVSPSVIKIGATWTMVWEEGGTSDGTYWATSANGIAWTNHGSLFGGSTYRATPSLYQFQNVVYVFSAQRLSGGDQLGLTFDSGPSMSALVAYGGGFVLRGSDGWNAGSVSMPRIVYQDGYHWMIFEGATQNLNCGATTAEQNVYGWGVARSTTLTSWQPFAGNPIAQSNDAESCGLDMPQPLLRANGDMFVYHTSDNTRTVERERLALTSLCTANETAHGWHDKNFVCMPSCAGAGGTQCYQTKSCTTGVEVQGVAGFPGTSYDCASCCH